MTPEELTARIQSLRLEKIQLEREKSALTAEKKELEEKNEYLLDAFEQIKSPIEQMQRVDDSLNQATVSELAEAMRRAYADKTVAEGVNQNYQRLYSQLRTKLGLEKNLPEKPGIDTDWEPIISELEKKCADAEKLEPTREEKQELEEQIKGWTETEKMVGDICNFLKIDYANDYNYPKSKKIRKRIEAVNQKITGLKTKLYEEEIEITKLEEKKKELKSEISESKSKLKYEKNQRSFLGTKAAKAIGILAAAGIISVGLYFGANHIPGGYFRHPNTQEQENLKSRGISQTVTPKISLFQCPSPLEKELIASSTCRLEIEDDSEKVDCDLYCNNVSRKLPPFSIDTNSIREIGLQLFCFEFEADKKYKLGISCTNPNGAKSEVKSVDLKINPTKTIAVMAPAVIPSPSPKAEEKKEQPKPEVEEEKKAQPRTYEGTSFNNWGGEGKILMPSGNELTSFSLVVPAVPAQPVPPLPTNTPPKVTLENCVTKIDGSGGLLDNYNCKLKIVDDSNFVNCDITCQGKLNIRIINKPEYSGSGFQIKLTDYCNPITAKDKELTLKVRCTDAERKSSDEVIRKIPIKHKLKRPACGNSTIWDDFSASVPANWNEYHCVNPTETKTKDQLKQWGCYLSSEYTDSEFLNKKYFSACVCCPPYVN